VACGPKTPANPPGSLPDIVGTPEPEPAFRRADLDYMIKGKSGKPQAFPSPMVRATVGGIETQMMVDTGANTHVITAWLARKAGLELRSATGGTDHAGRAIKAQIADHPHIAVETWGTLQDRPALVTEVPDMMERLGIGGFVSPQQLATEDKYVVLDLERAEMRTAVKDDLPKIEGRVLGRGNARVCSDDSALLRSRSFVVTGSVESHDVELLVDTGAPMTDLLAGSAAGKAVLPRTIENKDEVYAASGKVHPRLLKSAKLAIGEVDTVLDINVMTGGEDAFCPRDGVVAMDVLRHCVLIFGVASMQGFCKK
jgi:predicted aspartyl protease